MREHAQELLQNCFQTFRLPAIPCCQVTSNVFTRRSQKTQENGGTRAAAQLHRAARSDFEPKSRCRCRQRRGKVAHNKQQLNLSRLCQICARTLLRAKLHANPYHKTTTSITSVAFQIQATVVHCVATTLELHSSGAFQC